MIAEKSLHASTFALVSGSGSQRGINLVHVIQEDFATHREDGVVATPHPCGLDLAHVGGDQTGPESVDGGKPSRHVEDDLEGVSVLGSSYEGDDRREVGVRRPPLPPSAWQPMVRCRCIATDRTC